MNKREWQDFGIALATVLAIVLIVPVTVMMTGCQVNSFPDVVKPTDIRYFHDPRTGLCFAATNSTNNGYAITSITYVPCTPEVEKIAGERP